MERLRKMVKHPFAKFKKHFEKVERKSLTKQKLNKLESKRFRVERLQQVLDMFLFSCYTGLAYIDLAELTPDNIITGIRRLLVDIYQQGKNRHQCPYPVIAKGKGTDGKVPGRPAGDQQRYRVPRDLQPAHERLPEGNSGDMRNKHRPYVPYRTAHVRHYGYIEQWCTDRIGEQDARTHEHPHHTDLCQSGRTQAERGYAEFENKNSFPVMISFSNYLLKVK